MARRLPHAPRAAALAAALALFAAGAASAQGDQRTVEGLLARTGEGSFGPAKVDAKDVREAQAEASGQALEETTPTAARERRESDYRASAVQPAQQLKTAALLRWVAAAFGAALVLGAILTAICLLIRRRKHRHLREAEEYDE